MIPLDFWSESEVFNARSMPNLFGTFGITISLLLIFLPSPTFNWGALRMLEYRPALFLLALLTLYGSGIEMVGFVPATLGLLGAGFMVLGERRPIPIVLVSLSVAFSFYFIMDLLGIYFSPGELWQSHD